MKQHISCADTAKLLRQALKEQFPTVKFSVRSKTYSGGASIDVSWTDGPSSEQVKKVTCQFEGASFDGMIDLKSYVSHEVNGVEAHYGADFIFTNRHYTVEFLSRVANIVARKYGVTGLNIVEGCGGAYAVCDYTVKIGPRPASDFVHMEAHQISA